MTDTFLYRSAELDALQEAHSYYCWILSHFSPHLGERAIEVGAGLGNFSKIMLDTTVAQLTLVEPAINNFSFLKRKFSSDSRVQLVHGYLEDLGNTFSASFDSIILVNVLEHVEKDEAFLRSARQFLVEGGNVLLFVPAMPWLYGSLDGSFGHYRRYTKSTISQILHRSGFQLIDIRFLNFLGVVPWFLTGRLLKRTTLTRGEVRFYDRWVIPWISKLEGIWRPPFGQSLIAIARK